MPKLLGIVRRFAAIRESDEMQNQLKTLLLLGVLTTIVVAIGGSIGKGGLIFAVGFAVLLNVGAYWFSDKIVLRMHGAQPIGPDQLPEVYAMVEELTKKAGMPMPKVYVMSDAQPNAFATGRSPSHAAVAVTAGILDILDARELRGVIAHELAHVKNRDTLVSCVAAVMAGVVTAIANILQWSAIFGGGRDDEEGSNPIAAIALAIIAPIAATMVQFGISRSREFLADQTGAEMSGDPEALARALEKLQRGALRIAPEHARPATASLFIINPFSAGMGKKVFELFSTHPNTDERVRRLRAMAGDGFRDAGGGVTFGAYGARR